MTFEIRILDNDGREEWDEILSHSSQSTIFHEWTWLKIAERHTQMKFYPVVGIKDGVPVGVFPLFFKRTGFINMVFSPPPHTAMFYLGPVFIEPKVQMQEKRERIYGAFQNSVEAFITRELRAHYTSIALAPALQDPRPFTWSGYSVMPNYDYTINLSKGIDTLYQSLDRNQRISLKNSIQKGMIFESGAKKEYEKILDLMDIRYAEQGKIVTIPRQYFLDLYEIYKDRLKIFIVRVDGEIVTGAIRIHYGNTLYGWFGNSRPKVPISPSPNHFLFWGTIRFACENGIRYYTTLGAAGDKRLHSFHSERLNPELNIRYFAVKKTFFAGLSEQSYIRIIKPLRGRMKKNMPWGDLTA